ncbi:MAG: class I SAM-dependent methyltransferase [Lachnospiraceae bacterium]|nr:class I SAM-dependent methyltransferase [Lachnospiraceae bacterium]
MFEIGKVLIDDSHYAGQDVYSDGTIEDEMLEIAKTYAKQDYNKIIAQRENWPIFYHFSHIRENIVSWLPMDKKESVLEIGAGCGAITGALLEKVGVVTAVDLSMKRSLINAYRNKDMGNLKISVGNFEDVEKSLTEKYDIITLIGVFEYADAYIQSQNPYEDFLLKIKKHLSKQGRIVIAIENKYGLKYWAGCKEDHTGGYFEGLEGYTKSSGAKTFSKNALQNMFAHTGFEQVEFYYPYPDYKFPQKIFSDDFLPIPGELSNNRRNFDQDRLDLFDERKVFDGLIEDGMFPYFSNSFLVIIK